MGEEILKGILKGVGFVVGGENGEVIIEAVDNL